jgi:hypothetical protein
MRCVDQRTVSTWKTAVEVIDALQRKCNLCHVENFQPTHAREIARAFRCRSKDWDDDTKDQFAEWVERCEAEDLMAERMVTG